MSTLAHLPSCRIVMHALDHAPPHFHAITQQGDEAWISLVDLAVIHGHLRAAALAEVLDWAEQHGETLRRAWRELQR